MIIGDGQEQVIQNIKEAAQQRDLNRKVEVGDPNLTQKERASLLRSYLRRQHTLPNAIYRLCARIITWTWTEGVNWHTPIDGVENLSGIQGGAIITSNHFNPVDSTVVRKAIYHTFHERIYIVSQDTNLAMTGFIGFLMNYADIIPISGSIKYMTDYFGPTVKDMLEQGKKILIYPEQEMWLNYRKPRPPKRGAFYYAAANSVPVIPCFVEIKTRPKLETEEFYKTGYVLHILPPIYSDPEKSVRDNSMQMMETDYNLKKEAYEKAYGRPLTYDFEPGDIAGWIPGERQS